MEEKDYWVDFSGWCRVSAKSFDEAKEKAIQLLNDFYQNSVELIDLGFGITECEEV